MRNRAGGTDISRRGFLGASSAVGAAALVPSRARALVDSLAGDESTDVVVVGAGLAGLTAANVLRRAGAGVLVLEAREQPGGRVVADDGSAELGELTVLESHEAVLNLARELGVVTRRAEPTGSGVLVLDGRRRIVPEGSLTGDQSLDREVGVALQRLNLMAGEVDPAAPWAASNARERDLTTLGSWLVDNVGSTEGRAFATLLTRAVWAAEPPELSLLHALVTIAGAGGAGPLVNAALVPDWAGPTLIAPRKAPDRSCRTSRNGARPWASMPRSDSAVARYAIAGGAGALAVRAAAGLTGRVRAPAPVRRVVDEDGQAVVEGDGFTVRANRVVVALPASAAAQIVFEPALSADHRSLLRLSGGDVVSLAVSYPARFWERDGWSGWAASAGQRVTLARADAAGSRVLVHACGAPARSWGARSEGEQRRRVGAALSDWFGDGAEVDDMAWERDWRGGPDGGAAWSVVAPPGAVTSTMRAARNPHGRVHWAGTERATAWAGWLEGAVRSGKQAAAQVLEAESSGHTALSGAVR